MWGYAPGILNDLRERGDEEVDREVLPHQSLPQALGLHGAPILRLGEAGGGGGKLIDLKAAP